MDVADLSTVHFRLHSGPIGVVIERITPLSARRLSMRKIKGITFDSLGHKLAFDLIAKLRKSGVCEVYGLPKLGEVRLAHHEPDINHKYGRGVFGRLIPNRSNRLGVTFRLRKGDIDVKLTERNLKKTLRDVIAQRERFKDRMRGSERADRNKPG